MPLPDLRGARDGLALRDVDLLALHVEPSPLGLVVLPDLHRVLRELKLRHVVLQLEALHVAGRRLLGHGGTHPLEAACVAPGGPAGGDGARLLLQLHRAPLKALGVPCGRQAGLGPETGRLRPVERLHLLLLADGGLALCPDQRELLLLGRSLGVEGPAAVADGPCHEVRGAVLRPVDVLAADQRAALGGLHGALGADLVDLLARDGEPRRQQPVEVGELARLEQGTGPVRTGLGADAGPEHAELGAVAVVQGSAHPAQLAQPAVGQRLQPPRLGVEVAGLGEVVRGLICVVALLLADVREDGRVQRVVGPVLLDHLVELAQVQGPVVLVHLHETAL